MSDAVESASISGAISRREQLQKPPHFPPIELLYAAVDPQQRHRMESDPAGHAFDALEGQVVLPPLDTTQVGPMNAENMGERLLAQALSPPVGLDATAYRLLKAVFHIEEQFRSAA